MVCCTMIRPFPLISCLSLGTTPSSVLTTSPAHDEISKSMTVNFQQRPTTTHGPMIYRMTSVNPSRLTKTMPRECERNVVIYLQMFLSFVYVLQRLQQLQRLKLMLNRYQLRRLLACVMSLNRRIIQQQQVDQFLCLLASKRQRKEIRCVPFR